MPRTLNEIMEALPEDEREQVEARARELLDEIAGLRALRRRAGKTQNQMADVLNIRQPTVHRLEHQEDMMVSSLRRYVEAAGGDLELRVTLPGMRPFRLSQIGEEETEVMEQAFVSPDVVVNEEIRLGSSLTKVDTFRGPKARDRAPGALKRPKI